MLPDPCLSWLMPWETYYRLRPDHGKRSLGVGWRQLMPALETRRVGREEGP